MYSRDAWLKLIRRVFSNIFWLGFLGAIVGGVWAGALGFGFGVGALWGGVGFAVVGTLFNFIVSQVDLRYPGVVREMQLVWGGVVMFLLPVVVVIGGIVWIVRVLL